MSTEILPAHTGTAPAPDAATSEPAEAPAARPAGGPAEPRAPEPEPEPAEEQFPFRPRTVTGESVFLLLGSAGAAFAAAWLSYERILPWTGAFGFWLVWYLLLLAFYAVAVAVAHGRRAVSDHLTGLFAASVGVLILAVVLDQIGYLIFRGHDALVHANFFTQNMGATGPTDPLTSGGALHALIGSVEQVGIATVIAVPLGVLAALFMSEIGGPMARPVRALVQAMTALPEIIAGLFIYALFILTFGLRQTGFAAGLALAIMMIPYVARTSEVMLRLVSNSLREAAYALGSSQWRVVWNVVLPTARSGLTTAIVLGIARAIGETAPVLLTSGFSEFTNTNPFNGWQTSLPLYIYEYVREPEANQIDRAFGAALLLLFLILVIFTIARIAGGAAPGELTRRQRRRMARDLARPAPGWSYRAPVPEEPEEEAAGAGPGAGPDEGSQEAAHATA
jgi:phosphate transport system permease protein